MAKKSQKGRKSVGILHPLQTWATELGKDPETLKRELLKIEFRPVPGEPIPLQIIIAAIFGQEYTEKIKRMRLDNEERERNAARQIAMENETLVEVDKVRQAIIKTFVQPAITALDNCPATEWAEKVFKPILMQSLTTK